MARRATTRTRQAKHFGAAGAFALTLCFAAAPPAPAEIYGASPIANGSNPPSSGTSPVVIGVDLSVGGSDNITRVPTDEHSDTITAVGLDFAVLKATRLIDLAMAGDFSYLDYLHKTYSNNLTGRFDGALKATLIPERLTWVVQEDFGQAQLDPFTPVTPQNRENVNYLSTGPDFSMHLGTTGFVQVTGRFSRAQYSVSDFNSNRRLGAISVGRRLSSRSEVSANFSDERVSFATSTFVPDFSRQRSYARYDVSGARTKLSLDLGVTTVRQSSNTTSGLMAKLELSRKLSSTATVKITTGRDLTDIANEFRDLRSGAIGGIVIAPAPQSASSFLSKYASVTYSYERVRSAFAISANWEDETYLRQPSFDVRHAGVQLNMTRRLTAILTANLLGSWYKSNYLNADFDANDIAFGGGMALLTGRNTSMQLTYTRLERSVSGIGLRYHENRLFLSLAYRPKI